MSFYRKVRPHITGWKPIAALAPEIPQTHDLAAQPVVLDSRLRDGVQRAVRRRQIAAAKMAAGNLPGDAGRTVRLANVG